MVELFANSGDPDQMPHSVASDLGLHCLPVTYIGVFPVFSGLSMFFSFEQKCLFWCKTYKEYLLSNIFTLKPYSFFSVLLFHPSTRYMPIRLAFSKQSCHASLMQMTFMY